MSRNKNYSGYMAYSYLSPGIDYEVFKLSASIREEWAYTVPLSKSEEERAEALLEKNIVIDLHEHPTFIPEDPREAANLWSDGREFMA